MSESNSKSTKIRRAAQADAAAIAAAHVASWRAAYRGMIADEVLDGLSVEGRTGQWRRWLEPGGERSHTLVAEVGGEVCGFATVAIPSRDAEEDEGVGEVPALYLTPEAFGRGVGSALLTAAAAEIRAGGCREAILWMLEGNDRAARFYEREGWRLDGGSRASQYYPGDPGLTELRWRRRL